MHKICKYDVYILQEMFHYMNFSKKEKRTTLTM
jgi:hypothetical protein